MQKFTSTSLFIFVALLNLNGGVEAWTLDVLAEGADFFNYFSFFTGYDPTHGYVNYVDYNTSQTNDYIGVYSNNDTYIGCDHTNVASGRGRDSVRLTSINTYNYGLFILYLSHMPTGCGTWPAWWTFGPDWPNSGEIDILEGVDVATQDKSTLHTAAGCDFTGAPNSGFSGTVLDTDCHGSSGCDIQSPSTTSYGANFNSVGGGLYAMQWASTGISVWMWNEGAIPSNALSNAPNPYLWGEPFANWAFGSYCPSSYFKEHQVIFDLTFCGDWDGAVFPSDCPGKGSCVNYVQYNPGAFSEAYWRIHWMKVFQ